MKNINANVIIYLKKSEFNTVFEISVLYITRDTFSVISSIHCKRITDLRSKSAITYLYHSLNYNRTKDQCSSRRVCLTKSSKRRVCCMSWSACSQSTDACLSISCSAIGYVLTDANINPPRKRWDEARYVSCLCHELLFVHGRGGERAGLLRTSCLAVDTKQIARVNILSWARP